MHRLIQKKLDKVKEDINYEVRVLAEAEKKHQDSIKRVKANAGTILRQAKRFKFASWQSGAKNRAIKGNPSVHSCQIILNGMIFSVAENIKLRRSFKTRKDRIRKLRESVDGVRRRTTDLSGSYFFKEQHNYFFS